MSPAAKKSRFKSTRELRKFGLTLSVAFTGLAGLTYWRRGETVTMDGLAIAGAFFLVTGLVVPVVLGPIEWAWMKFAGALGFVMTRVILTLTFFLAITPIGLLMRILGRDPLRLRKEPGATTYWKTIEADGPGSRPDKPF